MSIDIILCMVLNLIRFYTEMQEYVIGLQIPRVRIEIGSDKSVSELSVTMRKLPTAEN